MAPCSANCSTTQALLLDEKPEIALRPIHQKRHGLGFHPHFHVLCTDGCFYGTGVFPVAPRFDPKDLRAIFEHRVLRMLLSNRKITL